MKDNNGDQQKPGSQEYAVDGQEPDPWGGGAGDGTSFDDAVPLHTGEVEILDEFIEESLDSDHRVDSYSVDQGETAVRAEPTPEPYLQGEADDGLFGEDDGLFDDRPFAEESGGYGDDMRTPVPGYADGGGQAYDAQDDELAVVDDYADALAADDLVGDYPEEEEYAASDDAYPHEGEYTESYDDDVVEVIDSLDEFVEEEVVYEDPDEVSWRTKNSLFKEEAQTLAMGRKWLELAALSRQALDEAVWARKGADRITLLLDLGRLFRDRLSDTASAQEVFALLADMDPTHSEALTFLAEQYRQQGSWERLYKLYFGAVAPTWDPNERLIRTQEAAEIALSRLDQPELAIDAWEQLWSLKDARGEAERELLHLYRGRGHWKRLAAFLTAKAEELEGGQRALSLREVAEVFLSGVGDRTKALEVLHQILELRPGDPVTLLTMAAVYSQEGKWEALSGLSGQTLEGVSADVNLEFVRLIADAFWKAGEYDSAYDLYQKVLAEAPEDKRAVRAVEEYLSQTDRHEDLLAFLETQVNRAGDEEEKLSLLSRMALLAQTNLGSPTRAAELWERCVTLRPECAEYYESLTSLYDSMADLGGVARALEGQLATRRDPTGRIELLRMLGEHFSERMEDDNQAERCWHEVLALSPEDYGARQQLLSISRRRGDFEGLNTALEREMALTRDSDFRLELARQSAQNLGDNFGDVGRAIAAWQRVLDLAPTDSEALAALEKAYEAGGARSELIFTKSRQIDAASEQGDRIALAMGIAELHGQDGRSQAAAAAYEWVLSLDPGHGAALEALGKHYESGEQVGKYLTALEQGSAATSDVERRLELFNDAAGRSSEKERSGRFFWLRRMLGLKGSDGEVLQALRDTADAGGLWGPLSEIYSRLVVQAETLDERRSFKRELVRILESEVGEKGRAYLELQSLLLQAEGEPDVVTELARLGVETERSEDYLAVLGAVAMAAEDLEERSATLRIRAKLCDEGIGDPARAFEEYRALLAINPQDREPLTELTRLAEAAELWQQLDEVYAELFDGDQGETRVGLCQLRAQLHRDKLKDPQGAFDLQILMYRLAPDTAGLEDALCQAADELGQWNHLLPILEAQARSGDASRRGALLLRLAALHTEHLEDADYAFGLTGEALVADPESDDILAAVGKLAESGGAWERLAAYLRAASARCENDDRRIALYELAAELYQSHDEQADQSKVMHRHILSLRPEARGALEALIVWHRGREEWDVLRDLLVKRIDVLEEGEDRVAAWLEVAKISDQQLKQPEQALLAYTEVLALDQDNAAALEGFSALESAFTEPTQHVRKMRAELDRAEAERAAEIRLSLARLLEDELEDVAGAKDVLHDQVSIDGPVGPAYDRLLRLYESSEDWPALADLLEARAGALEEPADQLVILQQAIDIRHCHLADRAADRLEGLYRQVLKVRPDDEQVLSRLVEQLRASSRWEDMAELLQQVSERMDRPEDKARALRELGRVLHLGMGRVADADVVYRSLVKPGQEDESAACALASFAAEQGNWADYLKFRESQAKGLPPKLAGLVYCHLAETVDEKDQPENKVSLYYRKARSLDSNNQVAMEGLRAIGRRLKNWREVAALLPDEDERTLSFSDRAERLRLRGDGLLEQDAAQALDWYARGVVVNPDDVRAWAGVSRAAAELGDRELAEAATERRLLAFERTTPPTSERLGDHVALITESAEQLMAAGEVDRARPLLRHAHELMPDFVPAALSVAEERLEADDAEGALLVAGKLLERAEADLTPTERIRALLCNAQAALQLTRTEDALDSFRRVLLLNPLHGPALMSLAELLVTAGRPIEAIQHFLRVLLVEEEEETRAKVYRQMGLLWEDAIGNFDEAAAAYERAMAANLDDPELLRRALRHLVRHGRREQALAVVEALLPVTEDSQEMADLWVAQGQIFVLSQDDWEGAVEAFDMALSYVPAYAAALHGLADVLEKREDWAQLLQILEASLELQTPQEQATSLRRMAHLYQDRLADAEAAEQYLRRSVELEPTREALDTLRVLYEQNPDRYREAYPPILGGLVQFGPPYFELVARLGELALQTGNERWGWALLSPLANVRVVSSDVKTQLRQMRKDYDKAEQPVLSEDDYLAVVRHRDVNEALNRVVAAVDEAVGPLGLSNPDDVNPKAAYKLSPNAGLGKTCFVVTTSLGLSERMTYRADGIAQNWIVVNNAEGANVYYLTEFLRQFVRAESSFLFGYTLEWTRPGHIVMAASSPEVRESVIGGILLATELISSGSSGASAFAERLREGVDEETLAEWADQLAGLRDANPRQVVAGYVAGIDATARRVGLLMAGDLLAAMRAWGRISETFDNPQAKEIEDLDELVIANPALVDMVAFASDEAFGRLLSKT